MILLVGCALGPLTTSRARHPMSWCRCSAFLPDCLRSSVGVTLGCACDRASAPLSSHRTPNDPN
jgi:hypothetical protein